MKKFIPTYEQALEMVNTRGELIFYESKFIIDDYNISLFCYRLATYNDFINPIIGKDYDARELRGISYVFDKDGTYKTFIMLRKFWNINQVPETQLSLLSNKKIKYINNKEDGSLISFIKLPNNRIVSKTKMGFFNEQTTEVDDIVSKNINISNFLQECFDKDYITLWEYVSFKNKIVLNYNTSDIVLLRVRDKDGEFIDIEQFRNRGFGVVDSLEIKPIENIITDIKNTKNIEGCVITFDDGYMVKQKSDEYFKVHYLLTECVDREDNIIEMVLNERIDDFISRLDKINDIEKLKWIDDIEKIVRNYMIFKTKSVDDLASKYDGNMKDFVKLYLKDPNFHLAAKVINGCDTYAAVKEYVLKYTYRLEEARNFIKNKGFEYDGI